MTLIVLCMENVGEVLCQVTELGVAMIARCIEIPGPVDATLELISQREKLDSWFRHVERLRIETICNRKGHP